MGMLRLRAAVFAFGVALATAAATTTAEGKIIGNAPGEEGATDVAGAAPSSAQAAADSWADGTVEEFEDAWRIASALRAAFRNPSGGEGDGLIGGLFDKLEEAVRPETRVSPSTGTPEVRSAAGERAFSHPHEEAGAAVLRSSHDSRRPAAAGVVGEGGLADRLIEGLDGSARGDLASKLIGGGLERAGALNLAEKLLVELGGAAAGGREEFAAALAEAFGTSGHAGGEEERAEEFPGAASRRPTESPGGGGRERLAGKLLAGLDESQQKEFAGALLSGMRRDAGGGREAAAVRVAETGAEGEGEGSGQLLDSLLAALRRFEPVRDELAWFGTERQRSHPADDLPRGFHAQGGDPPRGRLVSSGVLSQGGGTGGAGSGVDRGPAATGYRPWSGLIDDAPSHAFDDGGAADEEASYLSTGTGYFFQEAWVGAASAAADPAGAAGGPSSEVGEEEPSSSSWSLYLPMSYTPPQRKIRGSSQPSGGPEREEPAVVPSLPHATAETLSARGGGRGGRGSGAAAAADVHADPSWTSPSSPDSSPWSFGPLGGMFHRTFTRLLPTWRSSSSSSEETFARGTPDRLWGPEDEVVVAESGTAHAIASGDGGSPAFGEAEWSRRSAQARRLYSASSQTDESSDGSSDASSYGSSEECGNGGNCQIEIVASVGNTSTYWNDALYTVEVGTVVPGQTATSGTIIARGTISEGESSPETQTLNLERGCYVLYTTAGSRPYDVIWEVQREGELYQDVHGGGQDFHTFGVGGALCGMSECYRQCYEEHDHREGDCSGFGDLLAPSTEAAGANCTCTAQEELELRLMCLQRDGCDDRSQCYLIGDDVGTIATAPTLTIEMYVTVTTAKIDTAGMEGAVAQWLDLDASYVTLVLVNGQAAESSTLTTRKLREDGGVASGRNGRGWGQDGQDDLQEEARDRRLQSATFKRLEFQIIGDSIGDLEPIEETINEGVRALNIVLAAQDEESGVKEVQAYTAEPAISMSRVASGDVPDDAIAGSGGGTGVDEDGELIVTATEAPEEFGDFTRQTQFLIGAGLVVVVSFFLSIVACIVCHMKRRERKEFKRKNATVDGRPKAVAYVDPWGSVARTFQKEGNGKGGKMPGSASSSRAGSRLGSAGSASMMRGTADGKNGSQTADSSASA